MNIENDFRNIKEGIKDYKLYKLIQSYAIHKWFKNLLYHYYIKEAETMAIILITALLVVIMLGLSFLSYLSENNLLDDIEN